jgi:L-alanine-DL-glutamate epimerase-like enolase superfamily enzyme
MSNQFDVKVTGAELYILPAVMRVPIKFGGETTSAVICARTKITVASAAGTAEGWGETPLSVGWGWPSKNVSFGDREDKLIEFCGALTKAWSEFDAYGHPMEIGSEFMESRLDTVLDEFNADSTLAEPMPHLAALICNSLFDVALHDAYGKLHNVPIYETYNAKYMNRDLASYLESASDADVSFAGKYPCDFFVQDVPTALPVWHLVGGVDPVDESELTGNEPDDGYPVLLRDWIATDGLNCLKIKLRGNDAEWDFQRIVKIGEIAVEMDVDWLTTDFNCMVTDPEYVNGILDRLVIESPAIYGKMLYVEQPFPYDMETNQIDVHSVSARKPLFMDESAHDWHFVRLGRSLGWTGVALKTCKTQTGALLSMCWAKAHGMTLMVQDLTNPMLAIVPHSLLAAHAGTIMGVECNAMQFYPDASLPEEKVHAKLYKRRNGIIDFSTVSGPGFGYRLDEIDRDLPEPKCSYSK